MASQNQKEKSDKKKAPDISSIGSFFYKINYNIS